MNRLIVFSVMSIGSLWLLWRDTKERTSVSSAVWIAVAWAMICSSRPVTSWLSEPDPTASRDEGNLEEAAIYAVLMVAGILVWMRRAIPLSAIVKHNGWLFVFYVFWCTSVLWSEYPFIALKRLTKDLGNVVMAVLLLTSPTPGEAIKAVVIRCAYVLIPLSIFLIRWVSDLGRSYVGYHGDQLTYIGVASTKNGLGVLSAVAAVFLLWDLLERYDRWWRGPATEQLSLAGRGLVLAMCWFLLAIVDSATSLVCAVLGSLLVVVFKSPGLRQSPHRLEGVAVAGALALWSLDSFVNLKEAFVERLGRDMTLTTRTDIWQSLLSQQQNPWFGAGFDSFWTGRRLLEVSGNFGGIIQAHNGYLETYLNGGRIALGLLGIVLAWGYIRIRKAVSDGAPEGVIRLVFLVLALVHNVAEASFNKVSLLWFTTVLAIMEYRRPTPPSIEAGADTDHRSFSTPARPSPGS